MSKARFDGILSSRPAMRVTMRLAVGLAIGLVIGAAHTVSAESLAHQMQTCAAESSDARRLACYDGLTAARRPAAAAKAHGFDAVPSTPASAVASSPQPNPPAASEKAEFGIRNGPLDAKQQPSRLQSETATVATVTSLPYGKLVITLDNGQVWQQIEAVAYFPLKHGDKVQISIGALGSYVLSAPSKRNTKVTRVR